MTTPRKTVLIIGLGPNIPVSAQEALQVDASQTPTLVAAEVEKAKAGGVDCSVFMPDPRDLAGTLEKLRAELREREWDAVSIGFGLRGLKEHTELFEGLVNLVVEVRPGAGFAFPLGPADVWAAIQRRFGLNA